MCGRSCTTNKHCNGIGGVENPCYQCGDIPGTLMYHKCFREEPLPLTPAATPFDYFPDEYPMCGRSCTTNKHCNGIGGVENPCYQCGDIPGTLMYHKCFREEPPLAKAQGEAPYVGKRPHPKESIS